MAPTNGPPDLRREQRVAQRLIDRAGLVPPVDVGAAAADFAEVEWTEIPGNCDGLVLGLNARRERPLVLVDRRAPAYRQRFTLAHELGHILLPWHLGQAFLCETSEQNRDAELFESGSRDEPEANRFAAELLLPTAWLNEQLDAAGSTPARVIEAIRDVADVSAYVACLKLMDSLPAGHAFAIVSRESRVLLSSQTRGTSVELPTRGRPFKPSGLDRWAHKTEVVRYGTAKIYWWRFRGREVVDAHLADPRSAREVLDELLDRHSAAIEKPGFVRQSLAGIVGAAKTNALKEDDCSAESLYVRFRSRFAQSRPLPKALTEDPDFEVWLHKRAAEVSE